MLQGCYDIGIGIVFLSDNFKKYQTSGIYQVFFKVHVPNIQYCITDSTLAGMAKYCHTCTSINCWALSIFNCFNFTPIPFYHTHTLLLYQYVVSFMAYRISDISIVIKYLILDYKNIGYTYRVRILYWHSPGLVAKCTFIMKSIQWLYVNGSSTRKL